MTDFQITCFLFLATYQSFTRAAEMLGISQPALSRQIAALEKSLGLVLFKRTKRGNVLTPEGRVMYSVFQDSHQKIQTGLDRARSIRDKNRNIITIGCNEDWRIDGFISGLIERFHKKNTAIQVEILQLGNQDLYEALEDGTVDLIFDVEDQLINQENVICHPIFLMKTYVMFLPTYPFAGGQKTLSQFSEQTFILISQGNNNEGVINLIERIMGYKPKHTITVNSAEAQHLTVKCGMGVAAVSEFSRNYGKENLSYIDTGHEIQVMAIYKKDYENILIEEFCEIVFSLRIC